MAELPHELMVEILSRLPAKSVIRFRCVRKSWNNLIFDSNFIKLHLSRTISRSDPDFVATNYETITKQANFIHCENEIEISSKIGDFSLPTSAINWIDGDSFQKVRKLKDPFRDVIDFDGRCTLLGSCNGVVCLAKKSQLCLLNPCTREYKIAIFDDTVDFFCHPTYGFGYDAIKDDYKLVQIVRNEDDASEVNVYSINDTSRSTISDIPYDTDTKVPGVFLDGAIYWLARTEYKLIDQVIAFDVGVNEFQDILVPSCFAQNTRYHRQASLTLGVIEGLLALLAISDDYIHIWVLKNDDANALWCQVFSTKTFCYFRKAPWSSYYGSLEVRPLYFTEYGELVIREHEKLVMYDLEEKTEEDIYVQGTPDLYLIDSLFIHWPSFVSLNSGLYNESVTEVDADE